LSFYLTHKHNVKNDTMQRMLLTSPIAQLFRISLN